MDLAKQESSTWSDSHFQSVRPWLKTVTTITYDDVPVTFVIAAS